MSRLKKPFRIEVSKSDVITSYRVHYLGVRVPTMIMYLTKY